MSWIRFQRNILSRIDFSNNYLWEWYISKFEFPFVFCFFETYIKDIYWTAKRTNSNFCSILLPCTSSNWIVVFYLFTADFIPLRSFWVKVVNIESIKVSYNCSFSSDIKRSASKLFDFLIFWIIKSLETITRWLIEGNFSIISRRQNVSTPSESIWNRRMLKLSSSFRFKVEGYNCTVEVSWYNWLSIRWCTNWNYKRFSSIDRLTFVIL